MSKLLEENKIKVVSRRSFILIIGMLVVSLISKRPRRIYNLTNKYFIGLKNGININLMGELESIYDPTFEDFAKKQDVRVLVSSLKYSGAINNFGEIDVDKIKSLVLTDNIEPYKSKYYSQTEKELYALSFLVWK